MRMPVTRMYFIHAAMRHAYSYAQRYTTEAQWQTSEQVCIVFRMLWFSSRLSSCLFCCGDVTKDSMMSDATEIHQQTSEDNMDAAGSPMGR